MLVTSGKTKRNNNNNKKLALMLEAVTQNINNVSSRGIIKIAMPRQKWQISMQR